MFRVAEIDLFDFSFFFFFCVEILNNLWVGLWAEDLNGAIDIHLQSFGNCWHKEAIILIIFDREWSLDEMIAP